MHILPKISPILLLASAFLNQGCYAGTENTTATQPGIAQHYTAIVEYNSGNSAELVDAVPVNTQHNWDMGAVVYTIKLSDVKEGNLLECTVDMEVTNDVLPDQIISTTSAIILTDSPLKLPGDPGAIAIGGSYGYNVTPGMHHGHITLSAKLVCPSTFTTDMYVNFCIYAQGNQAVATDSLTVNRDYGRLSLWVFSK